RPFSRLPSPPAPTRCPSTTLFRSERDGLTVPQLTAAATACDELDRLDTATAMWNRATAANPNDRELRAAAARWFEQQERYADARSEEHTSELQSLAYLVCRLLLEK